MTKKFNKHQYGMLVKCSERHDFTEWNDYVSHTDDLINLAEVDLEGMEIVDAKFLNKNG